MIFVKPENKPGICLTRNSIRHINLVLQQRASRQERSSKDTLKMRILIRVFDFNPEKLQFQISQRSVKLKSGSFRNHRVYPMIFVKPENKPGIC